MLRIHIQTSQKVDKYILTQQVAPVPQYISLVAMTILNLN